ncbi:hypothetical protein [Kitasatospora sp. NPDC088346]|uniref:hypothetical protein n=1 Tax=Kitasatospora sp. NPDC088346 TaxID=3364073 RepID=UPI00380A762A
MTRTVQPGRGTVGLVPAQRPAPGPGAGRPAAVPPRGHLSRAYAVLRGLRSMRPVPAVAQEPYGESDGQ